MRSYFAAPNRQSPSPAAYPSSKTAALATAVAAASGYSPALSTAPTPPIARTGILQTHVRDVIPLHFKKKKGAPRQAAGAGAGAAAATASTKEDDLSDADEDPPEVAESRLLNRSVSYRMRD